MFELPELPYPYDSLEPHIDEVTMKIHHDKHHAGYVKKLNAALEGIDTKGNVEDLLENLEELPEEKRTPVKNNGGGHANHTLFWEIMSPDASDSLSDDFEKAVESKFGNLEELKDKFAQAATSRFGSGWAWLTLSDGNLEITSTPNQDSPYLEGDTPLLGLDVWEHAYYLKYQNKRGDYIESWWNLVDWKKVSQNFQKAI